MRPGKSYLERLAWGTDAGCYRHIPEEVLMPADEAGMQCILERARREHRAVTFRAAGTSLSGQACGDGLLAVCGKKWEKYEVLDGGRRIRLQPGIIGARVSEILKPYGRCFTPDPASVKSAMVGGIVMNNASGMCCGTHANAERMIESCRIILSDGTILDTGDEKSKAEFAKTHALFLERIGELRERVRNDPELNARILKKYSMKNVTGLTILPFAECEDPFEIITRLMPGSEGTLAFVSEVTMRTGEIESKTKSDLKVFETVREACEYVERISDDGRVMAAEFFDRKAMRSVEKDFPELAGFGENAAAVLTKVRGETDDDPQKAAKWWAMRSGIFPAVGGTREIGTTCLIEDVAVPVKRLADFTADLKALFDEHRYPDAVIYGHALAGNWHFILNQRFDTAEAVAQYERMMRAVVELVVDKYDGSLKAEHGTGRNMAPFVKREWGEKAYRLMKDVKELFDPENILNPGVVFNDDPQCFIKNLKPLPRVDALIDRCIECGFCEVNCTTCGYALSSRQRIIVSREIARLTEKGDDPKLLKELKRDFAKLGRDMCAGDGLCSTSCPVKINTGEWIHALRARALNGAEKKLGAWSADNLNLVGNGVGLLMRLAALGQAVLGDRLMAMICRGLHKGSGETIPLWTPSMPHAVSGRDRRGKKTAPSELKAVYYPSCINQRMGLAKGDRADKPLITEMTELLEKAGYEVIYPKGMENLCCGMTWESKGMPEVANRKTAELEKALLDASEGGKWPVVCDQSPCVHRMREHFRRVKIYEPAEFIAKFLLKRLEIEKVDECVAIHPTCSMRKMGLTETLMGVATACAREVILPEEVGCCAFAGDKGFTHPGMNEWALRKLRGRIEEAGATSGYSNSRTCEIGLSHHSGIPYMSIAYLVNRAAKKKGNGK